MELLTMVNEVDTNIRGISRLLEAASVFPSTDVSALSDMLYSIHKLAEFTNDKLNEVFNYIMFMDETKEAPEPAATETSAKEKLTQVEDTTKQAEEQMHGDKKIAIVSMLKDGKPIREIAEQVGASTTYIYKIKSEVM